MNPTDEQLAIIEAVGRGDNCMVEALAGCAKSTSIKLALAAVPKDKETLVLAFNKKIKEDMEKDIKKLGLARDNLRVLTLNGLGHGAIQRALRSRLTVDNDKIYNLCKEKGLRKNDLADTMAIVRAARLAGLVPKGLGGRSLVPDTEDTWADIAVDLDADPILIHPARDILVQSTKAALAGTIDYDDQIYISTLLFGTYPRAHTVFVDEAQDLSHLNHLQVQKACAGQLVAVGDSHQAIYAWRGADHLSMQNLRKLRPEWTDLSLTLTFRCPKAVVERQQKFVPEFRAHESNLDGTVKSLSEWTAAGGNRAAILCRNNAPLISMAFTLLRQGVAVNFLGKDIGANLKRLYNKLSNNGSLTMDTTRANAAIYAKAHPEKEDRVHSLMCILEAYKSVDEALRFLTEARTNSLSLATGHKAKGLEWDIVYHLNPFLIPSKHVVDMEEGPAQDAALRQEDNLRYVINTRTKDKLFFVREDGLQ